MCWLNIRKAERNLSSFMLLTDDYSKKSVPNLVPVKMTECSFDLMTLRDTKWYKLGNFIFQGQNHHKFGTVLYREGIKWGPGLIPLGTNFLPTSPSSLPSATNTETISQQGRLFLDPQSWGTYTWWCFLILFIKDSSGLPLAGDCIILLTNGTWCS